MNFVKVRIEIVENTNGSTITLSDLSGKNTEKVTLRNVGDSVEAWLPPDKKITRIDEEKK